MTEANFQRAVLHLARVYRWKTLHQRNSIGTAPGWPDLVLCRPPRLLFVELKSATGKVSEAQIEWINALHSCGMEVAVLRPDSLPSLARVLGPANAPLASVAA